MVPISEAAECPPRKGAGIWVGKILAILIACCLFVPSVANTADCDKAKEIYASGTKLLNFKERARAFQEAVALCPSFAEAHVNLADAYENLATEVKDDPKAFNSLLDKAVAEYQTALKIKKDIFAAYLGLGDTYRVMGLYEKSDEAYKKGIELKPGHPRAAAGLEKIKLIKMQERRGLRTSDEILKHVNVSSTDTGAGPLMGFEGRTAIKDRVTFNNLLFDEWSAKLDRPETIRQLEELGRALSTQELASCNFVVEGHTDDRGGEERNMRCSWERSESVKQFLTHRFGISSDRIKTQGFGYSRPRVPNDTQDNMQKNRRVEILVIERSGQ